MHAQVQRAAQPPSGEHLDARILAADHASCGERLGVPRGVRLEARQLAEVDLDVLLAPAVVEAAQLRQALRAPPPSAFQSALQARPRARTTTPPPPAPSTAP